VLELCSKPSNRCTGDLHIQNCRQSSTHASINSKCVRSGQVQVGNSFILEESVIMLAVECRKWSAGTHLRRRPHGYFHIECCTRGVLMVVSCVVLSLVPSC